MAVKVWGAGSAGGADGSWSTAANWTSDTVPTLGDSVSFTNITGNSCTIDDIGPWTSGALTIGNYVGTITQNVVITLTGACSVANAIGGVGVMTTFCVMVPT